MISTQPGLQHTGDKAPLYGSVTAPDYLDMSIARPTVQWEDNRDELPANKYMNIEVADPALWRKDVENRTVLLGDSFDTMKGDPWHADPDAKRPKTRAERVVEWLLKHPVKESSDPPPPAFTAGGLRQSKEARIKGHTNAEAPFMIPPDFWYQYWQWLH